MDVTRVSPKRIALLLFTAALLVPASASAQSLVATPSSANLTGTSTFANIVVTSSTGAPSGSRGDRAKRFFAIEARGLEALEDTKARIDSAWAGFNPVITSTTTNSISVVALDFSTA